MRTWEDKDANGNKLTDGRICLVIKSDTDPDMPELRVYGKDKEEVLDKLAKTTETAQEQIHRMRKQPTTGTPPKPATSTPSSTATDVAKAVADLSNPATATAAVKTLLKAGGVDVDKQARQDALKAIADLAERWENSHPDYPKDPRNDKILINQASVMAGSVLRITNEILDAAYEELTRREMFFEPKAVPPHGSEATRTVEATTYRSRSLTSTTPPPAPKNENAKEQKWREILVNGTGKQLDDAIRAEAAGNREFAGFQEFANKLATRKTA